MSIITLIRSLIINLLALSLVISCSSKKRHKNQSSSNPPPIAVPFGVPVGIPVGNPATNPLSLPTSTPLPINHSNESRHHSAYDTNNNSYSRTGSDRNDDGKHPNDRHDIKGINPNSDSNYNPKDPRNLDNSDTTQKKYTGYADKNNNTYTDASPDALMNFLREYEASVISDDVRVKNLLFASSIIDAKIQSFCRDCVVIKLKILTATNQNNKSHNESHKKSKHHPNTIIPNNNVTNSIFDKKNTVELTLSGYLNNRVARMELNNTTEKKLIRSGDFRCLDLDDNSCETALLRVSAKNGAVAEIILRRTNADLIVNMNEQQNFLSNNFKSIRRMFYNTLYRTEYNQPIISRTLFNTFAVVNGRSGLTIKLEMDKAEPLYFKAPLVSISQSNNELNIPMKRNVRFSDLTDEEAQKNDYITGIDYNDLINEALLTKNNGLGQIEITLNLNKQSLSSKDEDPIILKILRINKPLVFIDEDNIFFSLNK
jgi:hypothetical protein